MRPKNYYNVIHTAFAAKGENFYFEVLITTLGKSETDFAKKWVVQIEAQMQFYLKSSKDL